MKNIYFGDFRKYVSDYTSELDKNSYAIDSIEWFLLKYLRRIIKATEVEADNAPGRVEGSMRSLMRFYIDNIDEKSELGDRCMKIYDQYRKTLRHSQTE